MYIGYTIRVRRAYTVKINWYFQRLLCVEDQNLECCAVCHVICRPIFIVSTPGLLIRRYTTNTVFDEG